MLTNRKREEQDWRMPRIWRAAIYLREPEKSEAVRPGVVSSLNAQRLACRSAATVLHAEVIGEFSDPAGMSDARPGLQGVLDLVNRERRLDYLIVPSLDRLAADRDEAFEIAWYLGFAGTVVIPADAEGEFPWTGGNAPG